MASGFAEVNWRVIQGEGDPADGDALSTNLSSFPIGTLYVNNNTGKLFVRNTADGVAADWVTENAIVQLLNSTYPDLWQIQSFAGKGFTAVSGFVTVAGTSEVDFVLMRNPSGSGVLVRLKEFILTLGGGATNTSLIRFYRSPTITDEGTPISINKVLATASQTSEVLIYQTPTISDRGSLIQIFSIDFRSFIRDQGLSRFLVEGADLLMTVEGSVSNIEHNITAVWAEQET